MHSHTAGPPYDPHVAQKLLSVPFFTEARSRLSASGFLPWAVCFFPRTRGESAARGNLGMGAAGASKKLGARVGAVNTYLAPALSVGEGGSWTQYFPQIWRVVREGE